MSEFLEFTCPKCGGHEISCVQIDACIEQKLRIRKDGVAEWYGDIDVEGDPVISHYQCENCGKVLDVAADPYDHEALTEYLKSLSENQEEEA